MKPTRSALLLLFLLLLHQSLFARAGLPLPKGASNGFKLPKGKNPFKSKWGDVVDLIQQIFSSSQQNQQNQQNQTQKPIEGLSQIKEYFYNFGYLLFSGPFDDFLDSQTELAIKKYQKYFNLQVTGDLNNETLQLISQPRCAFPDINFNYSFIDNVSFPNAQWSRKRNLTYGFLPESEVPDNFTKVFRDAFTRWANATGHLNFTETTYDDADIQVGFYNFTEADDGENLFGVSLIREKPPSNVTTAVIGLNGDMFWALPSENGSLSWEDNVLDLETVAVHEIGHLLGLNHSSMNESLMYPYILPSQQRKIELSNSDKDSIKQLAKVSSGAGGCLGVPSMTTLSLGFAYLLLMY